MIPKTTRTRLVFLLYLLAVTSCQKSKPNYAGIESPQTPVDVYKVLVAALKAGDKETAKHYVTSDSPMIETISHVTSSDIQGAAGFLPTVEKYISTEMNGEIAVITFSGTNFMSQSVTGTITMKKENGGWKFESSEAG